MGFIGNIHGPTKSSIMIKLGSDFFGCTLEQLERDLSDNLTEEWEYNSPEPVIDPVMIDENSRFYLTFYSKNKDVKRVYLDKMGIELKGKVLVYDDDEKIEKWINI